MKVEQRTVGGEADPRHHGEGAAVLERWAVRGRESGLARARCSDRVEAGRGPAARPRPRWSSRAAVASTPCITARGLLRRAGQGAGAAAGRRPGPASSSTSRRASASPSARWRSTGNKAVHATRRWSSTWPARPEGFWWFQKGEYDEDKLEQDVRERLPAGTPTTGYIDFQVIGRLADPRQRSAARRCCTSRWTRARSTRWARSTSRGTGGSRARS